MEPVGTQSKARDGKPDERDWMAEQQQRETAALEKLNHKGIESLTDDELENLPEEAIKRIPFIWAMTKRGPESRQTATMMLEMMLGELKYYLDIPKGKMTDKLVDAVKEFQKTIGAKPTGELLMGELDVMGKRIASLHPPKIQLPMEYEVYIDDHYALMKGTWIFQDGTFHAAPLQTSRIRLDRQTKTGIEAIAQVLRFGESDTASLDVSINDWEVLRWDAREIRAEMVGGDAAVSFTMVIDIAAKKVRMFRLPKSGHEAEFKPQVLELKEGWGISLNFWRKYQEEAWEMMAPAYREAMNKMRDLLAEAPNDSGATRKRRFTTEELDAMKENARKDAEGTATKGGKRRFTTEELDAMKAFDQRE
jgi:hypothetical protein